MEYGHDRVLWDSAGGRNRQRPRWCNVSFGDREAKLLMTSRPRISVCMATYNGERYVAQQLSSILVQLDEKDEIVIMDDASTDETCRRIRALGDPRIRLVEHGNNRGVLRTFEDALRHASGDVIFLSDQDDIWVHDKVSTVMRALAEHPEVALVASDTALIDEDGKLTAESYFRPRGEFKPGFWANWVRNRYGGCTLAFRAELLNDILPFPHRRDTLHDIWIGIRNSLSGHGTLYIDKPLVLNRRHESTATGRKRLGILRKLRGRLGLLLAVVEYEAFRRTSPRGQWRMQTK